jgi:DNA-binding transcriptional MerR regulator
MVMAVTVGELSRASGVTVRTLHHYDEIGLCRPSQRTAAGYRLYDEADVLRLQQVLVLRELGLPLDEIAAVLDGAPDRAELLSRHRDALVEKRGRLDAMLAAVDVALNALGKGPTMQSEDFKKLFDGFDPAEHEAEVVERWGNTDAYKESARRTKSYTKADWDRIKAEAEAQGVRLRDLMLAGKPVTDPDVQACVDEQREHITRWFYPCSKAMQKQLGAMYVVDPRFKANLDKIADGYAQYLSDAIAAG